MPAVDLGEVIDHYNKAVADLPDHNKLKGLKLPGASVVLDRPRTVAVVICPSNPFISIEPILAVPGIRAALADCAAPVVAVSPLIGGRAIKGPTAKMMAELGMTPSAGGVARRYDDLIDGYVCDFADLDQVAGINAKVTLGQTLMTTLADREALARTVSVRLACCAIDDTRRLGGGAGEGIRRREAAPRCIADGAAASGAGGGDVGGCAGRARRVRRWPGSWSTRSIRSRANWRAAMAPAS